MCWYALHSAVDLIQHTVQCRSDSTVLMSVMMKVVAPSYPAGCVPSYLAQNPVHRLFFCFFVAGKLPMAVLHVALPTGCADYYTTTLRTCVRGETLMTTTCPTAEVGASRVMLPVDIINSNKASPLLPLNSMEVASSRPDHLPTLSAAKTSKLSLLVKHHILVIIEQHGGSNTVAMLR